MRRWCEDLVADLFQRSERGEHAEVRTLLEGVVAATDLESDERALLQNNLAWTLLETGEPRRAIALARATLDGLRREDRRLASTLRGTIGCALAACGEPEEAIDLLDDVMARDRSQDLWLVSARLYYRGIALSELGRGDEALAAWEMAHEVQPHGLYGQRAHECLLRHQSGSPYR